MKLNHKWHRGSGKTCLMVQAAKDYGFPVAVVANTRQLAEDLADRIGGESEAYGVRDIILAYESGLPVFIDHSAFVNYAEQEWVERPGDSGWRPLYASERDSAAIADND